MPITSPYLDDRTYADLMEEALALIPAYAHAQTPEQQRWTNYNPSDPGITLIELFAYISEILLYRVNRVSDASYRAFLQLLHGPKPLPDDTLDALIRQTVLSLRERYRAVTAEDYEYLATNTWPQTPEAQALGAEGLVQRARCLPQRNLELRDPAARKTPAPGHMSLIIAPRLNETLHAALTQFFDPRRLLTTHVHIVGPRYVKVGVRLRLTIKRDSIPSDVKTGAIAALKRFLDPLKGGPEGRGWPFGRNVYVSEIYDLLDTLDGVDYVEKAVDNQGKPLNELKVADSTRYQRNSRGDLVAVKIQPDELVEAQIADQDLDVESHPD